MKSLNKIACPMLCGASFVDRRTFLKTAAATGFTALAPFAGAARGHAGESEAYRMVAATDRQRILTAADCYLSNKPLTITAFPAKRSAGGLHDFFSQADYFWPNPKNPDGPYINRDGQSNPDNFDDHRRAMIRLSIQMPALTAAWLLTKDKKYGNKAADHLRAWFIHPETVMTPNLEYSQGVHGVST